MITVVTIEFVFADPMNKYDTTHITLTDNVQGNKDPEELAVELYATARRMYERIETLKRKKVYDNTPEEKSVSEATKKAYTNENNELDDLPF